MNIEDIKRMASEAGFSDGEVDYIQSIIIHFAKLVAQHEREACAKQLDALGCDHCATAIRARGQA